MNLSLFRTSLICLLSLVMLGCEKTERESGSQRLVKIGLLGSESFLWESSIEEGAKLYLEHRKTNPICAAGVEFELLIDRSSTSPESAIMAANRFISNEQVFALIGPNISETALPVAELAERTETPMISLLSSHPAVTENRKHVFQMILSNQKQAEIIGQYLSRGSKSNNIAVVYNVSDAYSRNFANTLKGELRISQKETLVDIAYTSVEDYKNSILTKLSALDFDFILLPVNTTEATLLTRLIKAEAISGEIIGTDYWQVSIASYEPIMQGALIFDHWHPSLATNQYSNPVVNPYFEALKNKPTMSSALAFDTMRMIDQLFCQTPSAGKKEIVEKIAKMRNFDGAAGQIYGFEENRAIRDFYVIRVDGDNTRVIDSVSLNNEEDM